MKSRRHLPITKNTDLLEKDLQDFCAGQKEIILAYLFGSLVARKTGPVNDIDIAILVEPDGLRSLDRAAPYGYRAQMTTALAHLLRCDRIDLVVLNEAPPLLLREVVGKGKLIYCTSEAERIRFEIAALKKHADTAHLREIKRLYMRKRIDKGLDAYA